MRQVLPKEKTPDHVGLAYDVWGLTGDDGKIPDDKRSPMLAFILKPRCLGDDGKIPDDKRSRWLSKVADIRIAADYTHSYERWKASFTNPGDRLAELTLASRLLIGHGNASAVDVGLTVHHTWGVPIIPGSALKGLLAHYVDATYGPSDPGKKPWEQKDEERTRADYQGVTWNRRRIERGPGAVYRALFGAPDAREDATMREHGFDAGAAAGLVTFHDALYVPDSAAGNTPFAVDVLTVHQKSYYDSTGRNAPNDYDSPNPVAFLTVRPKCRFLLVLSGPGEWTDLAARLLADALENWGVGGKTAAGYGIGTVGEWKSPEPRRSKTEQAIAELEKHGKDAQCLDIERWLRGEAVTGPMRDLLSSAPGAASKDVLDVVRAIGAKFELREAWSNRMKNKKADEQKKARARALIEAWDKLFSAEDNS